MDIDINTIKIIVKNTIIKIDSSRDQIINIIDNIKNEQESLRLKLEMLRKDISKVIDEVDELERMDKAGRKRLAEVSSNFKNILKRDIREAYEKASEIRVKFFSKRNEEKTLRVERDNLEISLKKAVLNIEDGEKIISQISIALGYLESNILTALEGADKNNGMYTGIKVLEAQENERKRIARDIHDGPAQYMANAVMKADICKLVLQKDINEGIKELEALKEIREIADYVRRQESIWEFTRIFAAVILNSRRPRCGWPASPATEPANQDAFIAGYASAILEHDFRLEPTALTVKKTESSQS